MILFSEKLRLSKQYEIWREENNAKDCALSVIIYLHSIGRLKDSEESDALWNSQKFIREFNSNVVQKDFTDSCRIAGKLFKKGTTE